MEKEVLDLIKEKYHDMKKISNGDYSELEELENNPIVKRYLYLNSLKESRELKENKESEIIDNIMKEYGYGEIKENNNIWCYLYTSEEDNYAVYKNVEDGSKLAVINSDEIGKFESKNIIVYGNLEILDFYDRYYNLRYDYFKDCIDYNQYVAVKKLLKK